MLVVLIATLLTAGRNTSDLLRDKAALIQADVTNTTLQYLLPAEEIPIFMAQMIRQGSIDDEDKNDMEASMKFALAGAPQVQSVAYLHPKGWMVTVFRDARSGDLGASHEAWTDNAYIAEAVGEGIAAERRSYWGEPLFIEASGRSIIYFAHLVWEDGEFAAALAASIEVGRLSTFLQQSVADFGDQTFILTADNHVVAHDLLGQHQVELSPAAPLPPLTRLGDPILEAIWQPGWKDRELDLVEGGHINEIDGDEYLFLYRPLDLQGLDAPWLIGGYVSAAEADAEFDRLALAAGFGLAIVVLTILLTLKFGRILAGPNVRLAQAATAIEKLDFDAVPNLPSSRLREVDSAFRAFERMTSALRLFARYVPRRLVQDLMRQDRNEALLSEQRDITIMFADIINFTQLTSCMPPQACAAFLNEVFTDLTAAIEAEGGTVDKFIGDAVMAFWGAPESQDDHAARACRAAMVMRQAVERHNAYHRVRYGLRIGIHSGQVTVGNIGPESRVNYTIVGTPVNTAQRLEQLGKLALESETTAILTSRDTVIEAGLEEEAQSLGTYQLVAGGEDIEVFRL